MRGRVAVRSALSAERNRCDQRKRTCIVRTISESLSAYQQAYSQACGDM